MIYTPHSRPKLMEVKRNADTGISTEEARVILHSVIKNPDFVLPVVDRVVYTDDNGCYIEQYTFQGLLDIVYNKQNTTI